MAGRDLMITEIAMLREIASRRDQELIPVVEHMDIAPLTSEQRDRLRRLIVDELCELPEGSSQRRYLELEELLIQVGRG